MLPCTYYSIIAYLCHNIWTHMVLSCSFLILWQVWQHTRFTWFYINWSRTNLIKRGMSLDCFLVLSLPKFICIIIIYYFYLFLYIIYIYIYRQTVKKCITYSMTIHYTNICIYTYYIFSNKLRTNKYIIDRLKKCI